MPIIAHTASDAMNAMARNENIWVHSMAATPTLLLEGLAEHAPRLSGSRLLQLHLENAECLLPAYNAGHLRAHCFFASHSTRKLINKGLADYVPIMLSEIPKLFRRGEQTIDTALIQVSPPDRHGNCSLGISVEATRAACEAAGRIIAHVNPLMPRTHGDGVIHWNDIHTAYEKEMPLPQIGGGPLSEINRKIGEHVASLIDNGDCLQMGIGQIPDAVLRQLKDHQHLGIHTEMFSDGVIDLFDSEVIDNSNKAIHPGKLVAGFVMGSNRLYDFVDDNADVALLDIEYVNSINTISRNDQVVSINSALQIDITGQVCADSLGNQIYSGVGGQLDFVLGASLSKQGKSIIALPSTSSDGSLSRIVNRLTEGAGVVTTRANVHYVVTEFGVANLRGKTLKQRRQALSDIAHPKFRNAL